MELFSNLKTYISDMVKFIIKYISSINFTDILDIIVVTFIIFWILKFVKNTRTVQLLKGIAIFILFLFISNIFSMNATSFLISSTLQFGVLAILIVFQPELRKVLEQMGTGSVSKYFSSEKDPNYTENAINTMIDAVCNAVFRLSASGTGALIVFEKKIILSEIVDTGVLIDSQVSSSLLQNIFFNNAPLHDGAVIVRSGRIIAASCILPLTQNINIDTDMGTRHRAAIGLSESSDALVLVVSEETSTISIALNGSIKRGFTKDSLKEELFNHLNSDVQTDNHVKKFFKKTKNNK